MLHRTSSSKVGKRGASAHLKTADPEIYHTNFCFSTSLVLYSINISCFETECELKVSNNLAMYQIPTSPVSSPSKRSKNYLLMEATAGSA
jgi:hypothetical protein